MKNSRLYEVLPEGARIVSNKVLRMSRRRQKIAITRRHLGHIHKRLSGALRERFGGRSLQEVRHELPEFIDRFLGSYTTSVGVERNPADPDRVDVKIPRQLDRIEYKAVAPHRHLRPHARSRHDRERIRSD